MCFTSSFQIRRIEIKNSIYFHLKSWSNMYGSCPLLHSTILTRAVFCSMFKTSAFSPLKIAKNRIHLAYFPYSNRVHEEILKFPLPKTVTFQTHRPFRNIFSIQFIVYETINEFMPFHIV